MIEATATVSREAMRGHSAGRQDFHLSSLTLRTTRVGVATIMEGRAGESRGAQFSSNCGSTDSFIWDVIGMYSGEQGRSYYRKDNPSESIRKYWNE
jgi:hypothetical protein